mgnify:CR=1 FL=1
MNTQLSLLDIRNQIAKLEEVKIMVCDTPAWDSVLDAINELKKLHNEKAGTKQFKTY